MRAPIAVSRDRSQVLAVMRSIVAAQSLSLLATARRRRWGAASITIAFKPAGNGYLTI